MYRHTSNLKKRGDAFHKLKGRELLPLLTMAWNQSMYFIVLVMLYILLVRVRVWCIIRSRLHITSDWGAMNSSPRSRMEYGNCTTQLCAWSPDHSKRGGMNFACVHPRSLGHPRVAIWTRSEPGSELWPTDDGWQLLWGKCLTVPVPPRQAPARHLRPAIEGTQQIGYVGSHRDCVLCPPQCLLRKLETLPNERNFRKKLIGGTWKKLKIATQYQVYGHTFKNRHV